MSDRLKYLLCFIGLLVFICFPATALVQEYLGLTGVVIYIGVSAIILLIIFRFKEPIRRLVAIGYPILVGLFVVGLLAVFAVVYPMETAGKFSIGSDRDETLNISVQALFEGRYPYTELTPLGNEISVLPGAIFLAAPFVALGNAAYQNVFWVVLFLVVTGLFFRDKISAFIAVAAALILSPAVQYEYISGGDVLANSIYVIIFLFLALRAFSDPGVPFWAKLLSAVALGIGLASRFNFFLLLPLLFAVLLNKAGWKPAAVCVLTACVTAGSVILPFYLYAPAAFPPFTAANKLALYDGFIPHSSAAIILAALALSALLSIVLWKSPRGQSETRFYWMNAAVQLFPMLCGVALDAVFNGGEVFRIMHDRYGLMFLFFGVWGCWPYLFRKEAVVEVKPPPMPHI